MKYRMIVSLLLLFVCSAGAYATEYWPPSDPRWKAQEEESLSGETLRFETPRDLAEYLLWKGMLDVEPGGVENFTGASYLENLIEAAAFIATLQVADPDTIAYGGMREGEHLPLVIQSDNTQESVWVWSRYRMLTGDATHDANVEAAWQYLMNFPGYSEEGGTGPLGYYRVYNCAWGLWAVMGYEEAYGDTSYKSYGDSCAAYLMAYPLDIFTNVIPYKTLNGMVESWAVGSLYHYGEHRGDLSLMLAAARMGLDIKTWVEDNPTRGLGQENWALSGGATMWGLVNSYFKKRPDLLRNWLAVYASYLKPYDDSGTWNSAHNLWYSLGHYAVWDATGSSARKVNHRLLIQAMRGLDTDDDGGIPAQTDDPDSTDQSWVTNYLSFMGFNILIPAGDVTVKAEEYVVHQGGMLNVSVAVANNTDSSLTYSGWIDVDTPLGPYPGNPILGPVPVSIGSWDVLSLPLSHPVPSVAPPGLYTYRAVIDVGGTVVDMSEIPFLVIAAPR
jgi:hypothetical protein